MILFPSRRICIFKLVHSHKIIVKYLNFKINSMTIEMLVVLNYEPADLTLAFWLENNNIAVLSTVLRKPDIMKSTF